MADHTLNNRLRLDRTNSSFDVQRVVSEGPPTEEPTESFVESINRSIF